MKAKKGVPTKSEYTHILSELHALIKNSRNIAARTINAVLTATNWEIGRRIVLFEQKGHKRAGYGEQLLISLSANLSVLGRGYSVDNLQRMRHFFLTYPLDIKYATASRKTTGGTKYATVSRKSSPTDRDTETYLTKISGHFPLSWSHYVQLLTLDTNEARTFYHKEAMRGGWSVRDLKRQIDSQFYKRMLLSKSKAGLLKKATISDEPASPETMIKDPYILEFLNLKDEYSEHDLEETLIHHLETFLLELGNDFTFVARQKRLRIDDEWFRVDLVFYHRQLRCLVLIDLKLGRFTHADAGQMHLYCNYAKEHWTNPDENPPVGLILCAQKRHALARYALDGLPNKVMVSEYKLHLPDEKLLALELEKAQHEIMGQSHLTMPVTGLIGKKKVKS
jgi:predicted nuclease of restriction endonuclease-like (RecB) superfamily